MVLMSVDAFHLDLLSIYKKYFSLNLDASDTCVAKEGLYMLVLLCKAYLHIIQCGLFCRPKGRIHEHTLKAYLPFF